MMKKIKSVSLSVLLSLTTLPAMAKDDTLHLYSWAGIFDKQVLDGFTEQTGYKVQQDNYSSDAMLETKLLSGQAGYDIVIPSAVPYLQREIAVGAMQKYDPAKVPNMKNLNIEMRYLLRQSDPTLEYAAIAAWGSTGLGLNKKLIGQHLDLSTAPTNSWGLIFEPQYAQKLQKCGLYLVDSAFDVIPAMAAYLNLDPTKMDKETVDKVMEKLSEIRQYVYLDTGKFETDMANGSACAVLGFSGSITHANMIAQKANNGVELDYVIPKEGAMAWMTTIAIPNNAPNSEAANAFMNYLLEPKVSARMSMLTGFPTPVEGAKAYLPPEMVNNPMLYPPETTLARLFMGGPLTAKQSRYLQRKWSEFRSAQ
ncbi:extracellular solute-binding protein [Rhodanobacter aciditrophus]|uniref:Putrescine-binding periplasmic protein n=1 Tax=Rhodanobacter aciditrophus TaxID=1623218 RepID=A0ABW4AVA9_9GAMM